MSWRTSTLEFGLAMPGARISATIDYGELRISELCQISPKEFGQMNSEACFSVIFHAI
jgi:hypothetical protein